MYNIADVDYTPLIPFEEAYLKAVSDDLPWWSEILWRATDIPGHARRAPVARRGRDVARCPLGAALAPRWTSLIRWSKWNLTPAARSRV